MKNLKKILSLVLVAVVLLPVALVAGCTQGTYSVEKVAITGRLEMTREQYEEKYGKDFDYENANEAEKMSALMAASFFGIDYKLKGNGEVVVKVNLPKWFPEDKKEEVNPDEVKITWEESEDGKTIVFKRDGEVYETFKVEGKKLVGTVITLSK